jgi:two-component system response regulator RegX3
MPRVLIVEDEESFADALSYLLTREGFDVHVAASGPDALEKFAATGADLVLVDLMLPGMSGLDLCRKLRQESDVAIIILTAKDSEVDKVVGLEIGADDYVTKPYSARELIARVHAVLRRRSTPAAEEGREDVLQVGRVAMNVDRHVVTVDGKDVDLPRKEFELLELLMRNPGRVLTRQLLIDRVWGSDYVGDTKTLDVHVKRLRSKIEPEPTRPQTLVTVRGWGYKLDA